MTETNTLPSTDTQEVAILGGGCFWCVEAQYMLLNGVSKVESGFSGGTTVNPSYKDVCTGTTGHAEVVKVTFNPQIISYDEILAAFWQMHDPTQLNRQGEDVGTQYRSVIFYTNEQQQQIAEKYKKQLNDEKVYSNDVVTEIAPFTAFYAAEDYHKNYYNNNPNEGYCRLVIQPKVEKFKKIFEAKLKK